MKRGLRYVAAGLLGRWLANLLLATVRFSVEASDGYAALRARGEPVVYALWHGRLLPLTYHNRGRGIVTLVSQSADGEYIARVVEGWGYEPIRGSTTRGGGEALRRLVRRARSGRPLAITPDGPRGPRQRVQPGVIRAAQLSGRPLVPVAAGCSRAWWPGDWDRFCIPKPFSRVQIVYGDPRHVPRDAGPEELRRYAEELEREMNAMTAQVDGERGPDR